MQYFDYNTVLLNRYLREEEEREGLENYYYEFYKKGYCLGSPNCPFCNGDVQPFDEEN